MFWCLTRHRQGHSLLENGKYLVGILGHFIKHNTRHALFVKQKP